MSLITAGFLLIKRSPRPDWGSENLLPSEIISASDCLCPQFPDSYAIQWTSDSEENKAKGFDSVGLPTEFAVDFLENAAPPPPKEGYAPMGASGWFEVVKKLQPLPDGQFLGFELLNVEYGSVSHSWLCNHLEVHFSETLGIQPNRWA